MLLRALHPCRTAIFAWAIAPSLHLQHMGNRALTAPTAAHGQSSPHCTRRTWAIAPSVHPQHMGNRALDTLTILAWSCSTGSYLTSLVMTASSVDAALRRMKHPGRRSGVTPFLRYSTGVAAGAPQKALRSVTGCWPGPRHCGVHLRESSIGRAFHLAQGALRAPTPAGLHDSA